MSGAQRPFPYSVRSAAPSTPRRTVILTLLLIDPIPILGYLYGLVPLGLALAIRLIPSHILAEHRAEARSAAAGGKRVVRIAGTVIVAPWISLPRQLSS